MVRPRQDDRHRHRIFRDRCSPRPLDCALPTGTGRLHSSFGVYSFSSGRGLASCIYTNGLQLLWTTGGRRENAAPAKARRLDPMAQIGSL
jgi:hypothetical protein